MSRLVVLACVALGLGCGRSPAQPSEGPETHTTHAEGPARPPTATTSPSSAPTSAAIEPALGPTAPSAPGQTDSPTTRPARPMNAVPYALTELAGTVAAEDGRGNVLQVEHALAVDLSTKHFAPRSLDPVLVIGQLRYTHYRYPRIGVLRFVIARTPDLRSGETLAVQYASSSDRVVLTPRLALPVAR